MVLHQMGDELDGPSPIYLPVNQLLTPPEIPLTGPLSALYLGERWAARATR